MKIDLPIITTFKKSISTKHQIEGWRGVKVAEFDSNIDFAVNLKGMYLEGAEVGNFMKCITNVRL